jgi:hypothetical protein
MFWGEGALFSVKRPEREANSSPRLSIYVEFCPHFPIRLHGVVLKYRNSVS